MTLRHHGARCAVLAARRTLRRVLLLVIMCAAGHGLPLAPLIAQARPDTLSTRVRDSLIAAVLADTLDLDIDTLPPLTLPAGLRQSFTVRPTLRRYSVGAINASEQASYASWVARFNRATLRLDLTPLAYAGDTSTVSTQPQVGFHGVSPLSARLDVPLRLADTLRIVAQSTSFPGALSAIDAQALGTVGTGTIDLDAGAIGVAARVGVRYALTQALGSRGVTLSLRGGIEYDPKPTLSGADAVSWRGTTLRGGIGLNRATADVSLGAMVEMTRSFADSLGGLNLFPGGGALNVDVRALRFVGAAGAGFVAVNGFYSRPLDVERPDQPTRLIPVGDFTGVTASAAIPIGDLTLLPVLSYLREMSSASALVNRVVTTLDATGQTASASVGLSVPLGRFISVTPEVGGVFGTVGQDVSALFPRRVLRRSFSDPVRGGWVSLEVSIAR
jgi:hypothetical protein